MSQEPRGRDGRDNRDNGSSAKGDASRPPDKRTVAHAKAYLKDTRQLLKKHGRKLSDPDREKVEAALQGVEGALSGDESKRLSTALKELDTRVDQILGFAKKSVAREYTESILIAILIAVVLRAFVVEAFKIPTGSMIPTLAVGDHIFVNKFIYGLRVPLTNAWFTEWGTPQHGDVIVFRYPRDLSKDYIKRVVGVAGDRIRVQGPDVWVNGHLLERTASKTFQYIDEGDEDDSPTLGIVRHVEAFAESSPPGPGADAHRYTVIYKPADPSRLGIPGDSPLPGLECQYDRPEAAGECVVQPGFLFVMGDNRDNSSDSRVWGCVPTAYVKGKAMFVWWSRGPHTGVRWDRIGKVVD